jgi:hypothetical protein
MSDHFSYLYDEDNADFFQKEACASADAQLPRADEIVKTAAPASYDAYSMEKIASRIDQDIFIIKTAGEAGINMGAQARADGYLHNLFNEQEFEPEFAAAIFDKVAGEAISHDLEVARADLYKIADEQYHPWIDSEIAAVGMELATAAQLDKEAGLFSSVGKALKGGFTKTKGMGFKARARGVGSAPSRGFKNWRADRAGIKRTRATERLGKAQKKLETIKAKATAASLKASKLPAGLRRSVNPGIEARGAKRIAKGESRVAKRQAKADKAVAKHKDKKDIAQGKPARSTTKPDVEAKPSSTTQQTNDIKTRKEKQTAKDKEVADDLKNKNDKAGKPDADGKPNSAAAENAAGDAADVTLGSAYTKMRDKGWGAMSGAEKQKLINAGLAGVVGHRVVMGKGVLTGGDGIV